MESATETVSNRTSQNLQHRRDNIRAESFSLGDVELREANQRIVLRYVITFVILLLYTATLIATFALFYLAGAGNITLSDTVLISLSGVLIGELGIGALLMQIVKSIFTNA